MKVSFLLLFITLAAAFTPIFAKVTVEEISPLSLGFFRFGFAAVLFYITLKWRHSKLKFEKKDYLPLIILGLLCIPINQFFFLTGIKMSYASHSGIIYSLNPVFAYMTATLRKTERFYYSKLFAILLSVIGIFIIFYESLIMTESNSSVITGDIMLVFAVLSFSLFITLGKEYIEKYGPLKVMTFVFLTGTLFNIPVFLIDMKNLTFADLSFTGLFGLFYLTVIISYIAYFSWYYALKTISVSLLTTLSNLSPAITVAIAMIFLGEDLSIYFVFGGFLAVIGVFLMHKITIDLG